MKDKKVLVSTDIGSDIDDALSLLIMFNSRINLRGIYTTNAKDLRFRSYISKRMVDLRRKKFLELIPNLLGKKITVAQGEGNALYTNIKPYQFYEDCFVDSSFEDEESSEVKREIQFKPLDKVGIISNGLEDLANKLEKEKYIVFSLAPLTNIAKLVQNYPDTIKNIERLYIMGGSLEGNLEHNIRHDHIAAGIVFDSNIPITIVSKELCIKFRMPVSILDQLKNSKVGNYVRHMAMGFIAAKTAVKSHCIINNIESDINHTNHYSEEKFELRKLLTNLNDSYFGAFESEEYFKQYYKLIKKLREINPIYHKVKDIANNLEENIPKDISVADVYVPYCFLHPEKLKIKKGKLILGELPGSSRFINGNNHEAVIDLDYNHFQEFLKKNLY